MADDKSTDSAAGEDASAGAASRQVLADYLGELKAIRDSGAGVAETSYYPALSNLFNAVGKTLKPKVRCIINLKNLGAGLPDAGLFTADQFAGDLKKDQRPSRGAIEAKGTSRELPAIALTAQVRDYLAHYGLVITTNLRSFAILAVGDDGGPKVMESFALADNEEDFWTRVAAHPRGTAQIKGGQFIEFIKRACLHNAPLTIPKDVAWFLASYARDALFRVEQKKELPALLSVRTALEDALGMKFTAGKGEHFFRSTLVQTLFYGVFSAWVRWHKDNPGPQSKFDWRSAEWSLHVPFIKTLYEEVAKPSRLGPLGLVEVLDWSSGVLNRVDRAAFFQRFEDEHAVQYFYEPFLEAYDPELRKELGVWYTPPEIVRYQVARVDAVLREELDLPDGLADPNVIVLDPCCGTGAYLVEVLKKIGETLREKNGDGLVGNDVKQAALHRVFGFEIMPAPFVIAHLQIGLLLQRSGLPFSLKKDERPGVYLTNSLTGWEPPKGPKQHIMHFAELEQERDAAEQVKRDRRILVVLGNPPYNAFAGVSPEEEQGLVEPYKKDLNKPVSAGGWGIKKFNLDDLYVRFFRLAERRIAEMSGKGVVSFISNHSWISDPSFVVLREHLLDSFDKFWIENLHGNRKISEYAPDGKTSETIFAISGFSVGIQQGVATSLWVKTGKARKSKAQVRFRDDINAAKAEDRRAQLLATLCDKRLNAAFALARQTPENRNSFRPETVAADYTQWPKIIEVCALAPSNGLMEKRGGGLIDIERAALESRMRDYFDATLSWDEYRTRHKALIENAAGFTALKARAKATAAESFDAARLRRYALRPFETRWCYYTAVNPIWNRARPTLWAQLWHGNRFLMTRPGGVADPEGVPISMTGCLGDNDYQRGHSYYFPLRLLNGKRLSQGDHETLFDLLGNRPSNRKPTANLSRRARIYLAGLGIHDPDSDEKMATLMWMHILAIGFSPAYLAENSDGIRRDWPRIPLPDSRKALETSAAMGEQIAVLLNTEADVPGVTAGRIQPILKTIGAISKTGGGDLDPNTGDFAVTAGWGHTGKDGAVMPGRGKLVERQFAENEATKTSRLLGETTFDIYLNGTAYWRNIPRNVWEYHIGGYQVIKKWLSYRENSILGRSLKPEETREVMNIARRIAAIILLQPKLDENYLAVKDAAFDWSSVRQQ